MTLQDALGRSPTLAAALEKGSLDTIEEYERLLKEVYEDARFYGVKLHDFNLITSELDRSWIYKDKQGKKVGEVRIKEKEDKKEMFCSVFLDKEYIFVLSDL